MPRAGRAGRRHFSATRPDPVAPLLTLSSSVFLRGLQPHYSNPLVAAKLLNVPRNTEILVVCKILADYVTSDNPHDPYEGKVEFKLNIRQ